MRRSPALLALPLLSCALSGLTAAPALAQDAPRPASLEADGPPPVPLALVEATRGDGPDSVLDIAEARAPGGFDDIEAVMPQAERAAIAEHYKRLAGFDPATLNARPSLNPPRRAA